MSMKAVVAFVKPGRIDRVTLALERIDGFRSRS
jgi:hypothetical protein